MFHQLALIGTTASGKSSLAIQIARKFNGVILSLDSLALYKQIDIASAKPSKSELELVKHFGVNEIYVNEVFSVGMFFKIYQNSLKWAQDNGCLLIITGGSGFYLKAMLSGLTPDVPKCEIPSNEEIYSLARKIDGDFAMKFSQNDSYRLEKWYQIYKFSNEIPSIWLKKNTGEPLIKELEIYEILWPTQAIRERIKERTHQMFKQGLLDEAKFLFDTYGYEQKALKSIGLKECAQYFRGEISNVAELEELITIHTTQLAKRQRTFNRSQFEKEFIGEPDAVEDVLIKRLEGLV
ncbi:tRNA (adenosine(37)-N6)-dimethylallyltransferase MiaA [Campylobacter sp. RM9344]|uniref:tRNA dimethylallyltransferase n=1 Tax=Campylobacter californiensis TaxID=1032243 RepID=A0AAW3ZWB3_9BACT|nr:MULTISPECIES: tRNA (adenosine(37)-N6)-dimethylallyltransferase MiaA [unclassified Campylobacter]MBE2984584.1 tRNA (adenosine(37)-N6)-dimethylallyltransferase MiaA [Campylobacter sp. RM6883]MBE2987051.1 tRNA (adenosine(37)-N6)-dimethylallyltransferase MiaA [Campylobacter sp. RM12919]MBE2988662.1 tRNA (adenosine(37)-N6)-dimethylallyltransferase MiaA [Campylobacter sp. RM12920]MBE2995128.1 tRNA (adenosine(37)-N6)-dimethylallyltransferase MiaA [Campylobacter sp. RM6913]MBE3029049.1 tRNA (adenos